MEITKASLNDIDSIAKVYAAAKDIMDRTGNPNQWKKGHPSKQIIEMDILDNSLYKITHDGKICGVFFFKECEDPTYKKIDGVWKNAFPYGVIHRVASDGTVKGVMDTLVNFCKSKCRNIKCDTHHDNKIMQHCLTKNGFDECGIIHLANGSPRVAYQYCED